MRNIPLLLYPFVVLNLWAAIGLPITNPIIGVLSFQDVVTISALVLVGAELWGSAAPTLRTAKRQLGNLALFVVAVLELALAPWAQRGVFVVVAVATLITLVDSCYVAFVTKGTNVMVSGR